MEFVNPSYLYGLLAISIPIIIHLFNFRRYRKVYFSNVRLLKELQVKTKRKSRLKHLLVLLARILAITALVLAFAQPYFPAEDTGIKAEESSAVSFYIDNSFSMDARTREQLLLEEAKSMALELARTYKASDVFQLMTNDLQAKHHRFVSREDFTDYVHETEATPENHDLQVISGRINEQLLASGAVNKIMYIISDFQKSTIDLDKISADSSIQVYLIPLEPVNVDNLLIDSCWFESPVFMPGQQVKLKVQIRNSGTGDYEKMPVNLILDEKHRAISPVSIEAGEKYILEMPFTLKEEGLLQGRLELSDYPVTFDDKLFLSFQVKQEIPVLVINDEKENPYLNALFMEDSSVQVRNVSLGRIDYSQINENNLVILNHLKNIPGGLAGELKAFVENGGSVLVVPPAENLDRNTYNSLLTGFGGNIFLEKDSLMRKVDYINADHPFFEDVFEEIPENPDLPYTEMHYRMSSRVDANADVLFNLQNGDAFLSLQHHGRGKVYVSASAFTPEAGNFIRHSLFVPVLYKMALMTGSTNSLYYYIGDNDAVATEVPELRGDNILKVRKQNSEFEFIPEIDRSNYSMVLYTHDQIKEAGNFLILKEEQVMDGFSMNYNRKESLLTYYSMQEIKEFIQSGRYQNIKLIEVADRTVAQSVSEINKGTPLWKLFIILALAFLAMEIALIRLWK